MEFLHTYLILLIFIVLNFNSSGRIFCYGISTFNVINFGAKGNGVADDSQAFLAAMGKACTVTGGVVYVPSGNTFLLQTIKFMGANCQPGVTFQIDGKIVAPSSISNWKNVDFQWILFRDFVRGITIKGNGIIDGQGGPWWGNKAQSRPHAMRIAGSKSVTVTGIKIQNTPFFHLFIDGCQQVSIFGISTSSPKYSPNTDGIHLSNTQHANIHNATLSCGDDCISILSGCSDVKIYNVNCGPGHGYSIGGLGANKQQAQVSDINVFDSTVANSLTGVRIKTWQGGFGFARNITFSNIVMTDVQTPIVIDQTYCGGKKGCISSDTNAVAISGVKYEKIRGTFTYESISLVCSKFVPCKSITMSVIDLRPSKAKISGGANAPICTNVFGTALTNTMPPLNNCFSGR